MAFEQAPLSEPFQLKSGATNPIWERYFANTINPVVETIVQVGDVATALATGSALGSNGELLKRIENLETLIYASPQRGEDLSKRLERLEGEIYLVPLPRFYPVVDYEANPTVTSLRDNLITLGLMGPVPISDETGPITWEDEDVTWEDEDVTYEDI